ncbi:N-acetyltransferase [Sphingomonas paeninsulae]|uniref:N-acetyltransferase n=1 Tax=Sphingomonas paeninsulae TaxID=2319844 RepID=A0A494TBZ0_SPHPE|nr:N-acetyltransferase [Sphingomonas paeninsulae]
MSAAFYGSNGVTTGLATTLIDGDLRLEQFADAHVEGLRAACAEDQDIWPIYPFSMIGEHFDPSLARLRSFPNWQLFAVLDGGRVAGMTGYIYIDEPSHALEIGATYIAPRVRGSGFNRRMKTLMIDHAIEVGFKRIEFRVDTRNERSMAAVMKLGARHEGTLRQNRKTWTGYVRDTAIYSLLAHEWTASSTAG